MPAFNPRNWSQLTFITYAVLNTELRDQLLALKQRTSVVSTPTTGTDWTTTNTSYADVGADFTLSFTPNIASGTTDIEIHFNGQVQPSSTATSRQLNFEVTIDGASVSGGFGVAAVGGNNGHFHNVSFKFIYKGLSSGAHTIKLRWRVSGDTATLYAGASSGTRPRPQFGVIEVG